MKKKIDALKLRKRLGLNQAEFWGRIEVTQSGGSRYENGRTMPGPVRKLLGIVYLKERP
jgi:transcriptional regulator with XRE-family HTH domain